jgi:ATP-dependent helicase/nuclease subunit A
LRPSTALAAAEADQNVVRSILPAAALERGRIMHILLQHLPQVPPAARRQAAHRFLETRAANLDAQACAELVDEALAVLDLPQMRELFGPQSRAEVAVAGRLARADGTSVDIAGQIDRIVETETAVLIADFKTGSVPDPSAVPQAFVAQMALYKAVLAPLWPGKRLSMLLIFTAEGKIVELAEAALAAALRRLGFGAPAVP